MLSGCDILAARQTSRQRAVACSSRHEQTPWSIYNFIAKEATHEQRRGFNFTVQPQEPGFEGAIDPDEAADLLSPCSFTGSVGAQRKTRARTRRHSMQTTPSFASADEADTQQYDFGVGKYKRPVAWSSLLGPGQHYRRGDCLRRTSAAAQRTPGRRQCQGATLIHGRVSVVSCRQRGRRRLAFVRQRRRRRRDHDRSGLVFQRDRATGRNGHRGTLSVGRFSGTLQWVASGDGGRYGRIGGDRGTLSVGRFQWDASVGRFSGSLPVTAVDTVGSVARDSKAPALVVL